MELALFLSYLNIRVGAYYTYEERERESKEARESESRVELERDERERSDRVIHISQVLK
jgi:hypothetical protein